MNIQTNYSDMSYQVADKLVQIGAGMAFVAVGTASGALAIGQSILTNRMRYGCQLDSTTECIVESAPVVVTCSAICAISLWYGIKKLNKEISPLLDKVNQYVHSKL